MKPNSENLQVLTKKKYFISKKADAFFLDIHSVFKFITRFFKEAFSSPNEFKEIINQCYKVGVNSLPLITLTGFIIGIVFTKQSRPSLMSFGATSWLPSLVSIANHSGIGTLSDSFNCGWQSRL